MHLKIKIFLNLIFWLLMNKFFYLMLLFTTSVYAQTPGAGVTDIDGNNYATVIIGNQEWMAENLKVTRFSNGDVIANETDVPSWVASTNPLWCHYNNDTTYETPYGKMYNGYVAKDTRNVCPSGWVVPVEQDFIDLDTYLGGASVAGAKLKETGTSNWANGNTGSNSSGFNGIPGGIVSVNDTTCNAFGVGGAYWTSDERTVQNQGMFTLYLFFNLDNTQLNFSATNMGMNIRCLKSATNSIRSIHKMELPPIYPNPSSEKVFINLGNYKDVRIRVLDLSGKIMLESSGIHQAIYSLDIQQYPPAVYILEVQNDHQKQLFKLIKQ